TPDEAEAREKGQWAAQADEGVVPAELGGSAAPREMLADDPQLGRWGRGEAPPTAMRRYAPARGSRVLGQTTGADEPATESGVDLSAGDRADAVTDGGPDVPEDPEPALKHVAGRGPRAR